MRKNVKKLLTSNVTYAILFLVLTIYTLFSFSIKRNSLYDGTEQSFEGIVDERKLSDNKLTIRLQGKEPLLCNYYSNDETEKLKLWNELSLGNTVVIEGTLNVPSNNTVPNTFNYKKYLESRGIFYTCTIEDIEMIEENDNIFYSIKNFVIDRTMTFENKDYLYTMIIGDKSLMDEDVLENYRNNGVTHLFAISGMHVGLFAVILRAIFKKTNMSDKKADVLIACFIWFYAFLASFGASVTRASLLFTLVAIDKFFDLEIPKIKILFWTGAILILWNYRILVDIGFIYSFVTTFGLIYASKIIEKHKIIGTSSVANLFSLPISINSFYKFNLASIGFNIIFVPFVSAVIYPLCLITFIFRFCEPILSIFINILEFVNSLCAHIDFLVFIAPKLNILVFVIYYGILLAFIKKGLFKTSVLLFSICFVWKLKPILDENGYVEFMDVGQGDCAIIRTSHNEEVIMIDTGGKAGEKSSYKVSQNVITYLYSLGINKVDYLILSHGDADHLGDAQNVLKQLKVKNIILNEGEYNPKEKELLKTGLVKERYSGKLKIDFLNNRVWNDENDDSIVLHFSLENKSFLFMGDASKKVEQYIMTNNKLKTDVIKLGHHGSKTSSDEEFLKSLGKPETIISAGRNNRYHHPNKETIETLDELKLKYYNTQNDGTIIYKLKNGRVTVSTYPP